MICSFFLSFLPPVTFGVLTNIASSLWSVLVAACLCRMGWTSCFCFLPESTHSRVMYFSIFSMACLLGLATWQVLYLRRYFKAKKLIEWCGLVLRVLHVSRMVSLSYHHLTSQGSGVQFLITALLCWRVHCFVNSPSAFLFLVSFTHLSDTTPSCLRAGGLTVEKIPENGDIHLPPPAQ